MNLHGIDFLVAVIDGGETLRVRTLARVIVFDPMLLEFVTVLSTLALLLDAEDDLKGEKDLEFVPLVRDCESDDVIVTEIVWEDVCETVLESDCVNDREAVSRSLETLLVADCIGVP